MLRHGDVAADSLTSIHAYYVTIIAWHGKVDALLASYSKTSRKMKPCIGP